MQDRLSAAFSNPYLQGNFLDSGVRVTVQIDKDVSMVGQEGPFTSSFRHTSIIPEI